MNEKLHNSIQNAAGDASLTQHERQAMRRRLLAYMAMKPQRSAQRTPERFSGLAWVFSARPIAAALVLAVFVSSGGVSYAAQSALPGDALYAIKTQVNEPIAGALATSPSAKAAWAMTVAGTRVQEAATLAAQGKLSSSTQEELQKNFDEHAQVAIDSIAQEASTSPESGGEVAVRFEAQLSAYDQVLAQVGSATSTETGGLASAIRSKHDRVAMLRAQTFSQSAATSSDALAIRFNAAAKAELGHSSSLARAAGGALASSSLQSVDQELNNASDTIASGETFLDHDSNKNALGAFQQALSASEQVGVFLKTSASIHARTGLVISEPQKGHGTATNGHANTAEKKVVRPAPAALMLAPAASSTITASSSATTSQGSSSNEPADSNKTDESHDIHDALLPVSVPVPLSNF